MVLYRTFHTGFWISGSWDLLSTMRNLSFRALWMTLLKNSSNLENRCPVTWKNTSAWVTSWSLLFFNLHCYPKRRCRRLMAMFDWLLTKKPWSRKKTKLKTNHVEVIIIIKSLLNIAIQIKLLKISNSIARISTRIH